MAETYRFMSTIEAARGGGAVAQIPQELVGPLGGLKQMRMDATLNGIAYKASTMPYRGAFYVSVHREVREEAGVSLGDEVTIELTRDTSPRVLALPPELAAALEGDPVLRARFDALSFSRRRGLADPISGAKKPETRAARLQKALDRLRELDR